MGTANMRPASHNTLCLQPFAGRFLARLALPSGSAPISRLHPLISTTFAPSPLARYLMVATLTFAVITFLSYICFATVRPIFRLGRNDGLLYRSIVLINTPSWFNLSLYLNYPVNIVNINLASSFF